MFTQYTRELIHDKSLVHSGSCCFSACFFSIDLVLAQLDCLLLLVYGRAPFSVITLALGANASMCEDGAFTPLGLCYTTSLYRCLSRLHREGCLPAAEVEGEEDDGKTGGGVYTLNVTYPGLELQAFYILQSSCHKTCRHTFGFRS